LHKRQGVPINNDSIMACEESEVQSSTENTALVRSSGNESSVVFSSMSQQLPSISSAPVGGGYADGNNMQLYTIVGMPSVRATPIVALAGGHVVGASKPMTNNSATPSSTVDCSQVVVKSEEKQQAALTGPCVIDTKLPLDIIALKTAAVKATPELKGSNTSHISITDVRPFSTPGSSTCSMSTDEPQTVPCLDAGLSPSSPDEIVLERKRARNRVAAQKCRMRKIERIEELSDRVRDLRGENERLAHISAELRQQIADLKREILSHVNSGCRVMVGSSSH
jgi:bZIP transcription factor